MTNSRLRPAAFSSSMTNEDAREFPAMILTSRPRTVIGISPLMLNSGAASFRQKKPDVVPSILDYREWTATRSRRDRSYRVTPIWLSPLRLCRSDDRIRARDTGFDDAPDKPVEFATLERTLAGNSGPLTRSLRPCAQRLWFSRLPYAGLPTLGALPALRTAVIAPSAASTGTSTLFINSRLAFRFFSHIFLLLVPHTIICDRPLV